MIVTNDSQLITPALGLILGDITRDSLSTLAPKHGLTPVKRSVSIDELCDGVASGRVAKAPTCGAAAIITPIVGFSSPEHGVQTVSNREPGSHTCELHAHLLDTRFDHAENRYGWLRHVA